MGTLSDKWADDQIVLGGWASVPDPLVAETIARTGFDFVCVDTQHGWVDYSDSVPMLQGILYGGSTPIVRVPWNEPGIIGKSLDAGAEAVIVPMVNSIDDAVAALTAGRYAPDGSRSFGPTAQRPRIAGDLVSWARQSTTVIPMIETVDAVEKIDEILGVGGIEAIYVGPADLSVTLGLPAGNNDGDAAFDDALAEIVAGCRRNGVVPGIHASGALTARRVEQGFRLITVSGDIVALRRSMSEELAEAKGAAAPESADGPY
ncbi:MAG: aldolase/citrate lyase family protein [Actinomycetota bacterium]